MTHTLADTVIVMPAFNESEVILQTIADVRGAIPEAKLIVVSDGSTDDTVAKSRAAGVDVLKLPFNVGVGGAMRLGFRYALLHGFNVVVQLDADGQHNPTNVRELVEGLDNADVVIGARFAGSGTYKVHGLRKIAMVTLSKTLSGITGARLTDTTSGFKAHGPRAFKLFAREYPAEYLGDTIEAIVIGHRSGLTYTQVPVEMRERSGGIPSHSPVRSAIYLVRAFLALVVAFLRPRLKAQ